MTDELPKDRLSIPILYEYTLAFWGTIWYILFYKSSPRRLLRKIPIPESKSYCINHYMISKGRGLIVIPESHVPEFKRLLVAYYENRDNGEIVEFMRSKCWRTF